MENFITLFQNLPLKLSPEIFNIGTISIRWYSLGYILAFFSLAGFMKYRIRRGEVHFGFKESDVYDCLLFVFLGVILGGRLGYAVFYQFDYYFFHPLEIFLPFRQTSNGYQFVGIAGMSYHGGMLGFVAGFWWFCKKNKISFLNMLDLAVAPAAFGYTFGRLGNFMNGELYGRETDFIWGMFFLDEQGEPFTSLRHASQLYEAFFEGILIFAILYSLRNRRFPAGTLGALYLFFYGFFRFGIEFFRQPDQHFANKSDELGTVFYWMSMGQVLCGLMMLAAVLLLVYFRRLNVPSKVYYTGVAVPKRDFSEKTFKALHGKKRKKRKKK